jgi:hypothetical protein
LGLGAAGGKGVVLSAYMFADVYNVTGDDTQYYLGAAALTRLQDTINIGGGTYQSFGPAQYTVPLTGEYLLTFTIRFNGIQAPIALPTPPVATYVDPCVIETTNNLYAFYPNFIWNGYQSFVSGAFSVVTHLTAGNTVKWYVQVDYRPGPDFTAAGRAKVIGIDSTAPGPGGKDLYFTHVGVALLSPL